METVGKQNTRKRKPQSVIIAQRLDQIGSEMRALAMRIQEGGDNPLDGYEKSLVRTAMYTSLREKMKDLLLTWLDGDVDTNLFDEVSDDLRMKF